MTKYLNWGIISFATFVDVVMFLKRDIFPHSCVAIRQQLSVVLTQPNSEIRRGLRVGLSVRRVYPPQRSVIGLYEIKRSGI